MLIDSDRGAQLVLIVRVVLGLNRRQRGGHSHIPAFFGSPTFWILCRQLHDQCHSLSTLLQAYCERDAQRSVPVRGSGFQLGEQFEILAEKRGFSILGWVGSTMNLKSWLLVFLGGSGNCMFVQPTRI